MEEFKLRNFSNLYKRHLQFSSLSPEECCRTIASLKHLFFGDEEISITDFYNLVDKNSVVLDSSNACSNSFEISSIFSKLPCNTAKNIYVSWDYTDSFSVVDVFCKDDFIRYFSDIWYSSTDDIRFFDEQLMWIVSLTHYGVFATYERA